MKCFYFSTNSDDEQQQKPVVLSRGVSWARSLSLASSSRSDRDSLDSTSETSVAASFHQLLLQQRNKRKSLDDDDGDGDLRVFKFSELKSATKGFSRNVLIGEGGFGCVYKGVVTVNCNVDGMSLKKINVAVKQLNRTGFQGHKEWINEVNLLGVIKHPNLVKLVGYCAEDDERGIQRLLVYELMDNKSLEDHLLTRGSSSLSWIVRLRIIQDAARGLAYLHEEMEFQLIFRDFKASNILLDEHFNARLSDFGLARQGPVDGNGHVSTSVVGTIGYTAPEYFQTGRLSTKSDVWSFGVVLYEVITGRRAVERNLIVDPRLEQLEQHIESAQRLSVLANKCLMKNPKSRPKMSEIVEALGDIISETETYKEHDATQTANGKSEDVSVKVELKNVDEGTNLREMARMRSKSTRKLDWRNWSTRFN